MVLREYIDIIAIEGGVINHNQKAAVLDEKIWIFNGYHRVFPVDIR